LTTVPSALVVEGHVPSAYSAAKIANAVDSVAKEIPTTVNNPVPVYVSQTKGQYFW
jgi:hypothetical protein